VTIDNDIRGTRVGASEASALVGLHPHISAVDVYERLVNGAKNDDSELLQIGRALEPAVIQLYAEKTGTDPGALSTAKTLAIAKFPYLCATPDRLAYRDGGYRLIEAKTHSYFGAADEWGEPGTDEVPPHHAMQVQLTLAVTQMPEADLAVLFSGRDFRIYNIRANVKYQQDAYDIIHAWYEKHIKTKTPPAPDGHESYTDWLKREYPVAAQADVLEATPEDEQEVRKFLQWKAEMEHAEQKMLEAKQFLQLRIGDSSGLRGFFGSISYRNIKNSQKVDWKGIASELGFTDALLEKYTTEQLGHRVFRVTAKKGQEAA
jgi:putative phage-type endonuclease